MANWKKVIVSGSDAHLASITSSVLTDNNILVAGVGGAVESSGITYDGSVLGLGSSSITSTGASSILSGSFSGSFSGDGSGITGIANELNITSSEGTSGSISLLTQGLTFTAGEGIDISIAGQAVTFAGENASDTNKGIASFTASNFTVTSGDVALADSSTGAVLAINGTANEVEVSRTNGTVTVGLPDSVTITNQITAATGSITGDLTVGGNLAVNGDLTYINTTNLAVEDRFILLASGSNAAGDGGIVIQQATQDSGEVFGFDSATSRWAVTGSFDSTATSFTPDAFLTLNIASDSPATADARFQKNGNIAISTNGDIWIYS